MDTSGKIILGIFLAIFLVPFVVAVLPVIASSMGFMNPLIIIGVILVIIIIWVIVKYNRFITQNQKVKQAESTIDVYLKKRFDLIPNLVETVKGYKDYEANVLEQITKLRSDYASRNEDDIKQSEELNNRFTRLLAVVENYPELKANESFLNLQKNLSKVESELQAARRIYNAEVTEFNMLCQKVPSNIIASVFGFKEKAFFEIEEVERNNVSVKI